MKIYKLCIFFYMSRRWESYVWSYLYAFRNRYTIKSFGIYLTNSSLNCWYVQSYLLLKS